MLPTFFIFIYHQFDEHHVNHIVKLKKFSQEFDLQFPNYFFNVTLDFLVRGLVPLLFNESLQFIFDDEQVMNAIWEAAKAN